MPSWLHRLLVLLSVWYDPDEAQARHAKADLVTRNTWQSRDRAMRAVEAYRAEQTALRRH